jgi:hypothetical protein
MTIVPLNNLSLTRDVSCYKRDADGYYIGVNPILRDTARAFVMPLDLPNISSAVDSQSMQIYTDPRMRDYSARTYASVSDIKGGDVQYYADTEISVPYIQQVFDTDTDFVYSMYTDPMGVEKPYYYHVTKKPYLYIPKLTCDNKVKSDNCLSSVADRSEFQTSLMAKQMRPMLNQKYMFTST